ncbi:hypothetical protein [Paracraurococcus ruber]|uniref:Uncharacterized protein n=1 Tax=Paracraurococcus ruber TaxID=77675 RepID=A0ABS1D5Z9_9PROT|nr:hypothetical protein [Paracraurococcus ruber]MBK1661885.1 hypothetical protein [Paracraurococcus ruber]TDG26734.1 hypothetical protein E2C05_25010 [Paracraurococcus ruber]
MPLRRLVLVLPLLAAACAGRDNPPPAPLALRLGTALEAADPAADAVILRMDGFERLARREDAAIAFAAGPARGRAAAPPAAPGAAAEAAGQVLMPAFTALGDYAHGLAQLAAGDPVSPRTGPAGAQLARAAEEGLGAVQAASGTVVPAPVRSAGLAGIAALSDLPDRMAGAAVPAMLAEAAPHVAAVAGLLRTVIGAQPGQGTRGAIRARREGLDALHDRFLGAVAADRRLGPGERYAIWRSVAELREGDPAPGSFTALVEMLDRLEAAHAALLAGGPGAEPAVAGFEAAVARLAALAEAGRRG